MGSFNQQITKIRRRLAELLEQAQESPDDSTLSTQTLSELFADLTELERSGEKAEVLAGETQRANTLLRTLIDTMPAGIVICDAHGDIQLTNTLGETILGSDVTGTLSHPERSYTPHRLDGTPFPAEDMPLARALRHGETVSGVEILIQRDDYQDRIVLAGAAPVRDERGNIVSGVTIFQDITEMKRVQKALHLHAEWLQALHEIEQAILAARSVEEIASATLQHIPQLLDCLYACITLYDIEAREMSLLAAYGGSEITLDRDWRATIDNEWARALEVLAQGLEYPVKDVRQISPTSEWWRTLQAEGVRALVALPLIIEGTLIGSLNLGLHRPGPLTTDQMEVARELVIPLAIGIQQARLYEHVQHHADELEKEVQRRTRALRASEARFRTIFEETTTGIVRINHKGQMLDSNPALQTMLGYSDEELHGQPFTEFARHPDDIGVDADRLADLLADRQSSYRQKVRYIRKNGQTVWANLTISIVRKGQYTSPLAIAMVEDITEQKQAEEALIQSEKLALAGQLAASLAHEINNPLQSVIGCLGLAQESLADKDDPGPLLQIAMEELRRAASIVGDMRDFNRPTDPSEREPTDLNALIEQVLTLSEKKCREHQVNVQWQRVDDLPGLMLAPNRIHQVFLNLTLNAVEAMPDGGELRIQTAPTDDPEGARVTFADTGIGIAPDKLPYIFDPFYTTKDEGLGLGLFISRNIVREHGGEVKVQSQVGEGTTFTVWLPTGD